MFPSSVAYKHLLCGCPACIGWIYRQDGLIVQVTVIGMDISILFQGVLLDSDEGFCLKLTRVILQLYRTFDHDFVPYGHSVISVSCSAYNVINFSPLVVHAWGSIKT